MNPVNRLQPLLNAALRKGDYAEVSLIMAQMNTEVVRNYKTRCLCPDGQPHEFKTTKGADGFPSRCACMRCDATAPDAFCRMPMQCALAGRCSSEYACND